MTDTVEAGRFEGLGFEVAEVPAQDRKAYWVSPQRPELALDMNSWLGARAAAGWLETERTVWMDDPQPPNLPLAEGILLDQVARRLMLMPLVAEVKRQRDLPVAVADREKLIEQSAVAAARRAGLDPRDYLAFVRAQIAVAKEVQRAVLAQAPLADPRGFAELVG